MALFVVSAPPSLQAQRLRDDDYARVSQRGHDQLFRLEYDEAIQFFTELERRYPEHPGPPISRSIAIWLRELFTREDLDLDRFISPGHFTRPPEQEMDPARRKAFFEGVFRTRELASRYLESHPRDNDARYYMATSESAMGVFAYTIDRSFKDALQHGRRAYLMQLEIVEDDPGFNDAYLTLGTYEYVAGNLPWYIKWLATMAGYGGSEARGFDYIVRAAQKGPYVGDDARTLLMVLYVREGQYAYALEMARQMHARYPENFILHLNQAQILERMGRDAEAATVYAAVASRAEAKSANYQMMDLAALRYRLGAKLLELGDREKALAQFYLAASDPETTERDRALSHLRAGEILDTLGARDEAISHYQAVRQLQEVEGSHETAGKYLANPFHD